MATYYKYAERSAGSQVNWAEIGKNLTDTLNEESKLREQKKAAIDEATRKYGLDLENSPQGDDTSLNQWGLDFAAQAQEARLLQDRLLKSGKLKLKDYTVMRQNITDGTKTAFSLMDEYNAEYKEKMARFQATDPANASQLLETWLMEQAEGFANFKKSQLYINPNNFQVNVAMKEQDRNGVYVMSDSPNEFTTVNALRNRIKSRYDKYNVDEYLTKQVALLGTEIKDTIISGTSTKVGQKTTLEDITERDGAREVISAMIDAGLNSPTNISSVLTNDLGLYSDPNDPNAAKVPFTFTFNKKEMGKNVIYLENIDGKLTPQFTTEQKDLARSYMLDKINIMLTRKETIDVYTEPRPAAATGSKSAGAYDYAKDMSKGNLLSYFYSGNGTQIESARQAIQALPGVQSVVRGKNGVTVVFVNDEGKTDEKLFSFYDASGDKMSIGDFVKSMAQSIYDTDVSLDAITAGAYNIENPDLNQQYASGPDLSDLDLKDYRNAVEVNRRWTEWNKNRGNQGGGGQQGGGQQSGGGASKYN
jgi:hypothetical protein